MFVFCDIILITETFTTQTAGICIVIIMPEHTQYVFSEPPGNEMPHCTHHSDMVTPQHPPFYTCSLLFSQFPPSITDRQQSHCSDISNLNSSCTLFTFLLPNLTTTHAERSNIYAISCPISPPCTITVQYINLNRHYCWLQLLFERALTLPQLRNQQET
jgi:hypothetical protein